jgi:hypothetical protein
MQGVGTNQFSHYYDHNADDIFNYFGTTYSEVSTALAPNNNFEFLTKLRMPTSSTGTGTFNTKIWVRATASDSI